jgi:DNA (cytosine-5)-methyltransferase 1
MKIKLEYDEKPITAIESVRNIETIHGEKLDRSTIAYRLWHKVKPGQSFSKAHFKNHWFGHVKASPDKPFHTLVASDNCGRIHYKWDKPELLPYQWWVRAFTFPEDFKFKRVTEARYVMGMSVPPFMIQRIAIDISKQLLGREKMNELKTGPWKLSDLNDVEKNGLKVFSCFSCGGGSTMGYKIAGYDVIGCCEIDPKMMEIYKLNHKPRHSYLMGVQEFKNIPNEELPEELFNLDILDGSPPCSSFSMAGSREKKWGKKKKFREGQAEQVLDDLFFHFIDVAEKLKPKVVVAENVKGLIQGNARGYVKQIFQRFKQAGYSTQLFLLNAARMGVPQKRERVFFIANRIDAPKIKMEFSEKVILFNSVRDDTKGGKHLSPAVKEVWDKRNKNDTCLGNVSERRGKRKYFNTMLNHDNAVSYTITASNMISLFTKPRLLNSYEVELIQTFPEDFDYRDQKTDYICGMSVPPFMMQRIADQIYKQWLAETRY